MSCYTNLAGKKRFRVFSKLRPRMEESQLLAMCAVCGRRASVYPYTNLTSGVYGGVAMGDFPKKNTPPNSEKKTLFAEKKTLDL